jgi:hypothetical protein
LVDPTDHVVNLPEVAIVLVALEVEVETVPELAVELEVVLAVVLAVENELEAAVVPELAIAIAVVLAVENEFEAAVVPELAVAIAVVLEVEAEVEVESVIAIAVVLEVEVEVEVEAEVEIEIESVIAPGAETAPWVATRVEPEIVHEEATASQGNSEQMRSLRSVPFRKPRYHHVHRNFVSCGWPSSPLPYKTHQSLWFSSSALLPYHVPHRPRNPSDGRVRRACR